MSKSGRDKAASDRLDLVGREWVELEDGSPAIVMHRSRKARRAQARIDKLKWRSLDGKEKLIQ